MVKSARGRSRAAASVAVVVLCLITALAVPSSGSAAGVPPATGTVAVAGATIVGEQWLTSRTLQLFVATSAFAAPTPVEVMFPVGYKPTSGRRWPVTYYLAGTNHDQTAFRVDYNGEGLTASFQSIVVSPRGDAGYWSDWFNSGAGGPPKYESFVIQQLIPLVDANFRTVPDRADRAVMGESMGGFGVMTFAARHPEKFAAAASLSGAVDTNWAAQIPVTTASPVLQGGQPDAIFGPRLTQAVRWHGQNPTDLAENLDGVDLQVYTGNGVFDPSKGEMPPEAAGCALEGPGILPESTDFHNALNTAGIAHIWDPLPWGCHSVALFEYEISQAVPRFATVFANPQPVPTSFNYKSIEPAFGMWDWTVTADPMRALEFMDLHGVGRSGFTISGSGKTVVTTPPFFNGLKQVTVTVDGHPMTAYPDKTGRITFPVDLGPADTQQEYTTGAVTTVQTSIVRFTTHASS